MRFPAQASRKEPGLSYRIQMSAVWLWAISFKFPGLCFLILNEDENNPYLRGLWSRFNEMEPMEFCARCLLAYLVVSKGLTNRRGLHPIHFVGNGWWWDGGGGRSEGGGNDWWVWWCSVSWRILWWPSPGSFNVTFSFSSSLLFQGSYKNPCLLAQKSPD